MYKSENLCYIASIQLKERVGENPHLHWGQILLKFCKLSFYTLNNSFPKTASL
jgi:hypothetical protein